MSQDKTPREELLAMLRAAIEKEASDLHLAVPNHPVLRVKGALQSLQEFPALTPQHMEALLAVVLDPAVRDAFSQSRELDFSYSVPGMARFRVNAGFQRGSVSLSFRAVAHQVPSLEGLGLPEICTELASRPRGLVLVTGPTGSGKSTTLAAMVDHVNKNFSRRIITMEDPIEFLHTNQRSMVLQRELGSDTLSFASGLRHALRQDPDVIVVGELRDAETMAIALTAAETGHLVLSTLHTNGAAQSVERIVEVYPGNQQPQVRVQLSMVLEGVVFQLLLPRADGAGRVVAAETLVGTPAVRNLIRTGNLAQITTYMQTGARYGMQTLDSALASLVSRGLVSPEDARAFARDPSQLQRQPEERGVKRSP
jgi:twitching motility protein PilT